MAGQPPCITITNDLTCFLITLTKCAIEAGWAGHVLGRRRCQRRPVCSFVDSPGASARARTICLSFLPLYLRGDGRSPTAGQQSARVLANHLSPPGYGAKSHAFSDQTKRGKTIKCIPKLRIIQSNGASAQLHKSIMNFMYTVNQRNL